MTMLADTTLDTFRTLAQPDRIVRDEGRLIGAKALEVGGMTPGDVRPWKVDRTTLEQLAALINAAPNGVKMRYGHPPPESAPATLAKATNARIVDNGKQQFVAVDVKFTNSAKRIQNGDVLNQLFDLAEETPEDFGLSIVPLLNRKAMITADKDGLIPIRLSALKAIDFVDDAAATSGGLFSTKNTDPPESQGDPMSETIDKTAELSAQLATLKAEHDALKKANEELTAKMSTLPAAAADPKEAEKLAAKTELSRRAEITALCTLAKINDTERDLFLNAGFSRAEAQDYLKSSGRLSASNPPVSEGNNEPGSKTETPEDKFGTEYDKNSDVFSRQGLTRDEFIFSRKVDEGLAVLEPKKPQKTKAA
jgi:hypothetical protein